MRTNKKIYLWLALAAAAARASGLRPARALVGHDHDHPVCDDEYRSTVCPAACDADTLRDKCCIHEGEVATLLTVAMEAQSRAIAPRVERFEACTGGHVELVPFVGACTGLSCADHVDPVSDTGARPRTLKRQGSVSVDAAYRAMPTHHTPTEFDAKGSSGQSAWVGMMPDAAAAPPTPVNRASKWPGWSKK